MKKFLNFTFIAALGLAGCVGFDPDYRKVHFLDSKPYYIPQDSRFYLVKESDIGAKLNEAGINCDAVLWVAEEEMTKHPQLTPELIRELYSQNKLGCANPMSQDELEYIKHKEFLEQQEWQRQQEQWQREREMREFERLERERMDREDKRFDKMRLDRMIIENQQMLENMRKK